MIKNIKYYFGINKIDFNNDDFLRNVLEFIPKISVDVEFTDCVIKNIEIIYSRNGFLVELNSKKISDIRSSELDKFLNNSDSFIHAFNNFLFRLQTQTMHGEITVEGNKV